MAPVREKVEETGLEKTKIPCREIVLVHVTTRYLWVVFGLFKMREMDLTKVRTLAGKSSRLLLRTPHSITAP